MTRWQGYRGYLKLGEQSPETVELWDLSTDAHGKVRDFSASPSPVMWTAGKQIQRSTLSVEPPAPTCAGELSRFKNNSCSWHRIDKAV